MDWYRLGQQTALTKLGWTPIITSMRESERQARRMYSWFGKDIPAQYPEYSMTQEERQKLSPTVQQALYRKLQEGRGTGKWGQFLDVSLRKLGIDFMADGFGNDSRAGLTVGDTGGHQEAIEENDPRPRRMHPSTLANAPRTSGDPSETVSRAFDSHDAIAPRETGRPHTEYVG